MTDLKLASTDGKLKDDQILTRLEFGAFKMCLFGLISFFEGSFSFNRYKGVFLCIL